MNTTREFLYYQDGELVFGSRRKKISDYTGSYKGPFFLYDLEMIRARYKELSNAFGDVQVFYAMKANSDPAILNCLSQQGAGADVVSGGEIQRAIECGFHPSKIVYSGVGKTIAEIKTALDAGILQINVESLPELKRIALIARERGVQASVAIRLNPDVSIQTHPYIATGLRENKFGIELEQLSEVKDLLKKENSLKLVGVSLHLGSQMMDFDALELALQRLKPIFEQLKNEFRTCKVFDFGGGLGIFYDKQDLKEESALLKRYSEVVKKHFSGMDIQLQTEPGRWLVAHAGVLVTQVQYVKKTPYRNFIIVDSGMNHLLRPALYGAQHGVLSLKSMAEKMIADVVGPICESSDFFAKSIEIGQVQEGDFIVIQDVGAYGASMSSNYNLQVSAQEISF